MVRVVGHNSNRNLSNGVSSVGVGLKDYRCCFLTFLSFSVRAFLLVDDAPLDLSFRLELHVCLRVFYDHLALSFVMLFTALRFLPLNASRTFLSLANDLSSYLVCILGFV